MTKTQTISKTLLNQVAEGKDITQAVKNLIGEKAYEAFIGNLYNSLRNGSEA